MPFSQGVFYHSNLPLQWRDEPLPTAWALQQQMRTNTVLLHALAAMETPLTEQEVDVSATMAKILDRLEAKLDLAVSLFSQLIASQTPLPAAHPATLSAEAIEWTAPDGPAANRDIALSLFIDPRLPQPLQLPARVITCVNQPEGVRTFAKFSRLTDEVQDWLEWTVFRYHRRYIQSLHTSR